ncbi:fibrous sheath CABYR-binding protein-like isoform X5 [Penaeus japonicus]|uniref:fibrous sheath CABYR-binding protein-like isoform X5 n=1 Tax=Penaeus japonicus TaxID=27405 RepID=UPI001C716E5C|nr:fibrous sheath CABYR-binding protein-like isoform X5 [Penaeus japonicus]
MKAVVILALLGAACAAPTFVVPYTGAVVGAPYAHAVAPVSYASQHHAQDELGQVNYGFAHAGQAKNEVRDAFGNVAGAYTYVDADGKPVVVEYTAGVNGFQVKSNNLPVGPGVPEAVAVAGPEPIADTPEVVAARAEFQAAFDAAAAGSLPADVPAPVVDTPEVTAAKLEFLEAYNAAAAAAAAAPDDEEEVVVEAAEEATEAPVEAAEEAAEEVVTEEAVMEEVVPEEAAPLVAPEPVMDTEEVAQAKAEFEAAYAAAAAAAAAGELPEVVVVEGAPEAVMDTAEVAAAKAEFLASFDAAAAAAEDAPDFDLDGSVSRYSGYLSAVDGSLSPYYTNTLPFGAYGVHAPVAAPVVAPVAYHGFGAVGYTPFVTA